MKKSKIRLKIWLYLSIPMILLLVFFLMLAHFAWAKKYESRIYPGINIGTIELGGLNKEEARKKINEQADLIEKNGLIFELNDKTSQINKESIADSSDFTQQAFSINRELTLEKAFNQGRDNDPLNSFARWIFGSQHILEIDASYNIDREVIIKVLKNNFSDQEIPSQDAILKLNNREELEIIPEKNGLNISYDNALEEIGLSLANLSRNTIKLDVITLKPDTTTESLTALATEAKKVIELAPIKVKAGDYYSTINKERLSSWIKTNEKNEIKLDQEMIKEFISKDLSSRVDQEGKNPRFEIKNGKMTSWQIGVEGRKINLEKSYNQISLSILEKKEKEITLDLEIIPIISTEGSEITIKELIGTGHSNFSGSSSNRIKNIKIGADSVNGLLIKPDEEFSLVKALGEISERTGYFPELVIKGDKTIKEFGGGLCQVATTLFRSALDVGLPITARQNHSYRVSYYEPAGTDAAVYDPWPDIRFINDTGNYVLIQSRIKGNDIYFDFWGVKDGRVATSTKPVIFNITKPAPTKNIVSQELAPGQKKCTESAHNGADAYFDYTVTYADGKVTEKRFKSHYVPWQAVCLVGPPKVEVVTEVATSTKINENISTSTPNN